MSSDNKDKDNVSPIRPEGRIEFSDEDKEQLSLLGISEGDMPDYHTVLEVWRTVFSNIDREKMERISPQWANRIVSNFREVAFADMPFFRDEYFNWLEEIRDILDDEIASDAECLKYSKPEDDVQFNATHYRNLLKRWQVTFLQAEMAWEPTQEKAGAALAAISEVHTFLFGQTGLTQYLDNIKFTDVYTEADQQEVSDALTEAREAAR